VIGIKPNGLLKCESIYLITGALWEELGRHCEKKMLREWFKGEGTGKSPCHPRVPGCGRDRRLLLPIKYTF
jgi:hypothetical protein